MSTMEHLFMQLFERRAWVEGQLRQQAESCAQSLASNLLTHGRRPPPWLWSPSGTQELNREELISGILFPLPRATTPSEKQNSLFTLPAAKADTCASDRVQYNSYFTDTCASDKHFSIENRVTIGSSNHPQGIEPDSNMMVHSEAIEAHAELDPLARIQRSKSRQRDLEIRRGKKGKTMKHLGEENTTSEFMGRMTRSMAASLKLDCDKEFLKSENGIVTRSRYGSRKLECVDMPSKQAKTMGCIKNGIQEEAKAQTSTSGENKRAPAAASPACNECSKKNTVGSQLSEVSFLVQPKHLLFDSMECSLNDTSVVSANGESACRGLKEEQILLSSKHVQKEDGWGKAETMIEAEEADKSQVETFVVEDSECSSHSSPLYLRASPFECITHPLACNHNSSPLHDPSSRKAIHCVSENALTDGSLLNDFVTNKEVSLGNEMQNITEEHCSDKHVNLLINAVVSDSPENDFVVELKHPLDNIEKCDHSNALAAFVKESHGNSSEVSFRRSDTLQSVNEDPVGSGSPKALVSSASRPLQKEGTLNDAKIIHRGEEIEKAPYGLEEENHELLKVKGLECHSYPMSCKGKTSNMYFLEHVTDLEDVDREGSLGVPIQHLMEETCSRKTPNVTTGAGMRDVTEKGLVQQALTPNSTETGNAAAEARYFLRSSARQIRDSASFKSDRTNKASSLKWSKEITNHACEITWPKRKRMEGQSNNILGTSPRLRTQMLPHVQKGSDYTCKRSLEDASEVIKELQPLQLPNHVANGISSAAPEDHSEQLHRSKKRCMPENDADLKGKDVALMIPLPIEDAYEVPLSEQAYGESMNCLGTRDPDLLSVEKHRSSDDRQDVLCTEHTLECESHKRHGYNEELIEEGVTCDRDGSLCRHDSAILSRYDVNMAGCHDTMPEFEGFSIGSPSILEDGVIFNDSDIPSLTKERASLLEQLCRSRGMLSPVSRPSMKYKVHKVPDVYQSLPAGILEQKNLSSSLHDIKMKQPRARDDGEFTGLYDNSLLERPHSHSMPSSSFRSTCEVRKPPLTPPVGKLSQKKISGKSSSSGKVGSNPELICFRIDENCSTAEENGHPYEFGGTSEKKAGLVELKVSANREPLFDVTLLYQNAPTLISAPEKFRQRNSLDSVNTESFSATEMDVKNIYANKSNIDDRENNVFLVSGNKVRKAADSLSSSSRCSKPEVSRKGKARKRSQTVSGKGGKPNNIISNISSFIPLVRQKQQAAAPFSGKRDIKVKALEAAEAAKRLEEKKRNEREMRKAAVKLERERLEQGNVRQLELQRKQKEEARKKKEADILARKRQREEEGRKEKERKRRCVEEARKQQREHGEQLRADKEVKEFRRRAADEKDKKGKDLAEDIKRLEKGSELAGCKKVIDMEPGDGEIEGSTLEAHDPFKTSNDTEKVVKNPAELQKTIQDRMSFTKGSQDMECYEISPYKDSDDEDGEDDSRHKRKYIPLWARRESLEQLLISMQNIDPVGIFSRKRSFNLTEVLSPRILCRRL